MEFYVNSGTVTVRALSDPKPEAKAVAVNIPGVGLVPIPRDWLSEEPVTAGGAGRGQVPTPGNKRVITERLVDNAGQDGITVIELRELTGWHHGQASSNLSVLERRGRIRRLLEKRGGAYVYVGLPHVAGRSVR